MDFVILVPIHRGLLSVNLKSEMWILLKCLLIKTVCRFGTSHREPVGLRMKEAVVSIRFCFFG